MTPTSDVTSDPFSQPVVVHFTTEDYVNCEQNKESRQMFHASSSSGLVIDFSLSSGFLDLNNSDVVEHWVLLHWRSKRCSLDVRAPTGKVMLAHVNVLSVSESFQFSVEFRKTDCRGSRSIKSVCFTLE